MPGEKNLNAIGRKAQETSTNYSRILNAKVLFRLSVSTLALGCLLYLLPAATILNNILLLPFSTWILATLLFLIAHVIAALKWRYLLQSAGISVLRLVAMRAHAAGLFFNICLPSIIGGDFVRASLVVRRENHLSNIAVASVADRLIDTIALFLLMLVAALSLNDLPLIEFQSTPGIIWTIATVILVPGVLLIAIFYMGRSSTRVLSYKTKIIEATGPFKKHPGILMISLFISISVQMILVLLNMFIAKKMGITQPWDVWFFCWPAAKFIALAPISLGGIGVRDVALVSMLTYYGTDASTAFSQSLSWQAILFLSGLIGGLTFLVTKRYGKHGVHNTNTRSKTHE